MQIDEATVRHIARLARIRVTDEEVKTLQGELDNILQWVEQLGEIDTEGVEPMTSVVATTMKQRPDAVTDGDCAEDIVRNAPQREGTFFVVPRVVE